MAKKHLKNSEAGSRAEDRSKTGVNVRWDGGGMRSTYANVCTVTSSREEVVLMFGMNKSWQNGPQELTVEVSDRMILSPYTAKRLSMLRNKLLGEYESRFGEIDIEAAETAPAG